MTAAAGALVLSLDALPEGESRLVAAVAPAELGLQYPDYTFVAPVQVELVVRRSLEMFVVSGTCQATATGECCRCLAAAACSVQAAVQVVYQRKHAAAEELEAAADDADVEFVPPGTRELDLRELVREALVLELPVRVYCRADCRGLCAQCGHDLNQGPCSCGAAEVDPRWASLKAVRFT